MRGEKRDYPVLEANLPKSFDDPVDDFGLIELVGTKSNLDLDKGGVHEIRIERPGNCIFKGDGIGRSNGW